MPRKRPPAPPKRAPQPGDIPPEQGNESLPAVPLACFAVLAMLGIGLFYFDAPGMHLDQRRLSLNFLAAPDNLFIAWCGGAVANFSILDRWPIVLLAATVLLGAWMAGRLAILGIGLASRLNVVERQVFALGVGLNLLSLYALMVGLAGVLQQRWVFIVPLLLLAMGNLLTIRIGTKPGPGEPSTGNLDDARWCWWLLAALPFALVMVLGAMLPPWSYDVREYHLQTPKEWYQNGRIEFLPHNIYANMPLGSELTGLFAMGLAGGPDGWWWGAMAGKTVMACYSLIAAAGLVAFGQRLHSLAAGVIAAVIYLSTPWIVSVAITGYNEGAVALYSLLAIYALWLAARDENVAHASRLFLLSGFCAGSAVACKYPPLLFVVVPLACWVAYRAFWEGEAPAEPRGGPSGRLSRSFALPALFVVASLTACGPWFAKNWALTNNPTYPLLYSAFDGRTRTAEKDLQFTLPHRPQPDAQGNRFSVRQLFEQAAWNTWRTLGASLIIPPLALVALFARKQWPFIGAAAMWMLFVFVAWWLFTHRLDRFLVLLLPMAALIAAIGAFAVPHPTWRMTTLAFVLLGVIAQFPFVALAPDNRYFAPLARLRRDDTELGEIGIRIESAHRWLNQNAKAGEKVMLLGDAEPFDLELPAVYNTCFDDCQFTRIFKDRTREERLAALRAENIAYVFCSWSHLARYRSPGNYGYTSDYPTAELVREELVREQRILEPIRIESEPDLGQLFRVTRKP
jgi:hypothetical protein